MMREVYITSIARTPIGSFGGKLSGLSATQLGAEAIKGAVAKSKIDFKEIQEVFMGNVLSANLGQAPARQAAIHAGIGYQTPCTTINKVCASGMKSIFFAAQTIMLGIHDVVVAGGMESMSNVPFYIPKARFGYKYGNGELVDGLMQDGLWESYNNFAMGNCAEHTAKKMDISRQMQDEYAIQSYQRASEATKTGSFDDEIIPVEIPQKKASSIMMTKDEEYTQVNFDKIPLLRPVFDKKGSVTAANSSTISDGASAIVLMSEEKAKELKVKVIAKIKGFADAAQDPLWFTTAPTPAIHKALDCAKVKISEVDYWEINEAFAVVSLANQQKLSIKNERLNIFGGAVALGHPIGASGNRIVVTLCSVLDKKDGKIGVAGICNGGGGASAIVIEKIKDYL